jgi:peptidoglycan/xylan/chitin deacetylase (PgdA/CDA1 family)
MSVGEWWSGASSRERVVAFAGAGIGAGLLVYATSPDTIDRPVQEHVRPVVVDIGDVVLPDEDPATTTISITAPTTMAPLVDPQVAAGSADTPCAPGEKIVSVDTQQPWVSVSIDDGPSAATTIENSRLARERGQTLTFFFVASRLQTPEGLAAARQVLADGHEIGVHSLRHILNDADANAMEHDAANQIFQDTLGYVPYAYRAPGLAYSDALNAEVAEAGQCYLHVSLGADTNDWQFDFEAPEVALPGIQGNINGLDFAPGEIYLMHDEFTDSLENGGRHRARTTSPEVLAYLLDSLAAKGLQSVSTEQLLDAGTHVADI